MLQSLLMQGKKQWCTILNKMSSYVQVTNHHVILDLVTRLKLYTWLIMELM